MLPSEFERIAMTGTPVKVISERQGCNAPLRIGVSHIGQPLCIAGKVFDRGFGAHADSDIRIVSDTPMQEFRGWAGFDDNPVVRSHSDLPRLTFSVEAGGKTLWTSSLIRLGDAGQEVAVKLDGVKEFHLRVRASTGRLGEPRGAPERRGANPPGESRRNADFADKIDRQVLIRVSAR
jgi:hypothetical protein